jgi:hypothetical protein
MYTFQKKSKSYNSYNYLLEKKKLLYNINRFSKKIRTNKFIFFSYKNLQVIINRRKTLYIKQLYTNLYLKLLSESH